MVFMLRHRFPGNISIYSHEYVQIYSHKKATSQVQACCQVFDLQHLGAVVGRLFSLKSWKMSDGSMKKNHGG